MSQIALPTPFETERGSIEEQQAFKRRQVQDDSRSRDDLPIHSGSILAREGFTYEKYRVGCPPLQLLPLTGGFLREDTGVYPVLRRFMPKIEEILEANGIEVDEGDDDGFSWGIDFVHRTVDDETPSRNNLTLLIPAVWHDDAPFQWLHAVDKIRTILVKNILTRAVKVELIAEELSARRRITVLKSDDPIVPIWDELRPQIRSIINQNEALRDRWWSIGAVRMGYADGPSYDEPEAPLPTLSILVSWDVNPFQWQGSESQLKNLLRSYNLPDMDVHFSRGEICSDVFQLQKPSTPRESRNILRSSAYAEKIGMGADFGPAKYFTKAPGQPIHGPSGTIGGYIDAMSVSGAKLRLGLTNYHTVRPSINGYIYTEGSRNEAVPAIVPQGSDLEKCDRDGLRPDFPGRDKMIFESPSRCRHNFTIDYRERDLPNPDIDPARFQREQAELDRMKDFFDQGKHIFGKTWAASGYCTRTAEKGRLDWALLEVAATHRIGSNILPSEAGWPQGVPKPKAVRLGSLMNGLGSCKSPIHRDRVFKKGGSTGITQGQCNPIKDDVQMVTTDKAYGLPHSEEYAFIINPYSDRAFSEKGDSGSMIFTSAGKWMGLLWGGRLDDKSTPGSLCYATDAQALLQALNETFEGECTLAFAED